VRDCRSQAAAQNTLTVTYTWKTYDCAKTFLVGNAGCISKVLSEIKKTSYPNFQQLLILFEYDSCPEKRDEILVGKGGSNAAKRVRWHRAWTKNDPTPDAQRWLSTDAFVSEILTNEATCISLKDPPNREEPIPNGLVPWGPTVNRVINYPKQILNFTKAGLLALLASFVSAIVIAVLPLDNSIVGVLPMMGIALSAALLYIAGDAASKYDASTMKDEKNSMSQTFRTMSLN